MGYNSKTGVQEEKEEEKLRSPEETGVNEVSVRSSSNPMPTGKQASNLKSEHIKPTRGLFLHRQPGRSLSSNN
jgi:hypothetical protein